MRAGSASLPPLEPARRRALLARRRSDSSSPGGPMRRRALLACTLIVAFTALVLAALSQGAAGAGRATVGDVPSDAPPPCIDGQYAPNPAGSGCQVRASTTPTALCFDGT